MYISNSIKTEVTTVTPEVAKKLLQQNTGNRKVSPANLGKIKTAMIREEWVLNGEAIKVAKDGRILDGQHRLVASEETNTPFETLIVYGLDDNTQESMDAGKSRTAADALLIRGYKNSSALAAIVMAIIRAEQWSLRVGAMSASGYAVTTRQIVDRADSEPELQDLVRIASKYPPIGLSRRTAGLLYYWFTNIDPDDADDFFHKLASGENLKRGNPILTLRNLLINLKSERGIKDQTYIAALTIKAWNKYRAGQESFTLRFVSGGAKPEPFPEAL